MTASLISLTAAQLAAAAYPGGAVPDGWSIYGKSPISTRDGKNSFTVFINSVTNEIVFSFKGSDSVSNLESDFYIR